jgi:opacity protein-like surface antigen
MRKLAGLLTLLLVCLVPAMAQDTAPAKAPGTSQAPKKVKPSLYLPKYEVYGGFTYRSFYAPGVGIVPADTLGMIGGGGSFVYNLDSWIGLEAEIDGTYKDQGTNGRTVIYTGVFGPQFYPLKHRRLTPFFHALYGVGHYDLSFPKLSPFPSSSITRTASAWDLGGGVDFYVTKHLGVRAIQWDYDKQNYFSGQASRGGYRISTGVIYRFGEK